MDNQNSNGPEAGAQEMPPITVYGIPEGARYLLIDRGGIPNVVGLVKALGEARTILVSVEKGEIVTVFQGAGYVLPEWSNPPAGTVHHHRKD